MPPNFSSLLTLSDSLLSPFGGVGAAVARTGTPGGIAGGGTLFSAMTGTPSSTASHLHRNLQELGYASHRIRTDRLDGVQTSAHTSAWPSESPTLGRGKPALEPRLTPTPPSSPPTYKAEASAHCLPAPFGTRFGSARLSRDARDLKQHSHNDEGTGNGAMAPSKTPLSVCLGLLRQDNNVTVASGTGGDAAAPNGGDNIGNATRTINYSVPADFILAHQNSVIGQTLIEKRVHGEAERRMLDAFHGQRRGWLERRGLWSGSGAQAGLPKPKEPPMQSPVPTASPAP